MKLNSVNIILGIAILLVCSSSYARKLGVDPWVGTTLNGMSCAWKTGAGPYDYTSHADRATKTYNLILEFHFTKNVEHLISGTSGPIAGDLDYTLRGIPNHHGALKSVMLFQTFDKGKRSLKLKRFLPFECYIQRAIAFSPRDTFLYLLYASFLKKQNVLDKAVNILTQGEAIFPEDARIQYHLALILLQSGKKQEAVKHAKEAYRLGAPPKKLKKNLQKQGLW